MFTTGEYKGHPTVSVSVNGSKPFTFGLNKAAAVIAHIDDIKAWYDEQNSKSTMDMIACNDCGESWMWASDMPDMPDKPSTPTETLCPACKDANEELVEKYPLAGVELLDLNGVLQLPAGKVNKPRSKRGRPTNTTKNDRFCQKRISEWTFKDSATKQILDDGTIEVFSKIILKRSTYEKFKLFCAEHKGNERTTRNEHVLNWNDANKPDKHYSIKWNWKTCKGQLAICDETAPAKAARKAERQEEEKAEAKPTPHSGQMLATRDVIGPKHQGMAKVVENGGPLELKIQDPRTAEQIEAAQTALERELNYELPGMDDVKEVKTYKLPSSLKYPDKARRSFTEAYWRHLCNPENNPMPVANSYGVKSAAKLQRTIEREFDVMEARELDKDGIRIPPLPHQLKMYTKANREFAVKYWEWMWDNDIMEPPNPYPDVKPRDEGRIIEICEKAKIKIDNAAFGPN